MSLYSKFATDPSVENQGIFLDYGDGCKIRIRRAGGANKEYIKAIERLSRTHRFQIQTGRLSIDESRQIMAEVYANTIVLGWEGVKGPNGEEILFSKENCLKLFTDLPDLFADVQAQADNAAFFRVNIDEADAKN